MSVRLEVRDPIGTLLGSIEVFNPKDLLSGRIKFARMLRPRFYGIGFLELESAEYLRAIDPTMRAIEMRVGKWWTNPTVSEEGVYAPGRVDFCLIWDGPAEALRSVRRFQPKS